MTGFGLLDICEAGDSVYGGGGYCEVLLDCVADVGLAEYGPACSIEGSEESNVSIRSSSIEA